MTGQFFCDSQTTYLRPFVQGYWFEDCDFTFRWDRDDRDGGIPASGHDGSYLSVRPTDRGWRIGVDHDGNRRLFLYRDQDYVAVGDSLLGLAQRVHDRGRPLTTRSDQLEGWAGRGSFLEQLWSFNTVFREITLVPQDQDVLLERGNGRRGRSLRLAPRSRRGFDDAAKGYEAVLADCLRVLTGRIRTLLASNGPTVTTDLTGGLDSRTVFSIFAYVVDREPSLRDRVQVFSGPNEHQRRDREVAASVLDSFAMPVAHERAPLLVEPIPTSLGDRLEHWKVNRLGQYVLASYLPYCKPNPGAVSFSGVGAEKYRPFYGKWAPDLAHLLENRRRRHFTSPSTGIAFESAVRRSLRYIKERDPVIDDPLILHYQWFRSRFHGGCPSAEGIKITPLSGRHLDRVARHGGADRVGSRQIIFDIMANLCPALLDLEFDDPAKQPSDRNRRELTLIDIDAGKGELDIGPPPAPSEGPTSEAPGIEALEAWYQKSLATVPVSRQPDTNEVEELFATALRDGRFRRQSHMQRVHYVILYDQCQRLTK